MKGCKKGWDGKPGGMKITKVGDPGVKHNINHKAVYEKHNREHADRGHKKGK